MIRGFAFEKRLLRENLRILMGDFQPQGRPSD